MGFRHRRNESYPLRHGGYSDGYPHIWALEGGLEEWNKKTMGVKEVEVS